MPTVVTEIVAMEITPEEMEAILKKRELEAKDAAIEAKAKEICKLIEEMKKLGGRISADRKGKNRYLSQCGEYLYAPQPSKWGITFQI